MSQTPAILSSFSGSATPSTPLSNDNLRALADRLTVPSYDRNPDLAGTVHFAYGVFAAAHLGTFHDDMLRNGVTDAGIIAVIPRIRTNPATGKCDAVERANRLKEQDCLYTVRERDKDSDTTRVVGSLVDIKIGPEDRKAIYELMAEPRIKQITATVTQNGYSGSFSEEDKPDQFANYLVEALALRFTRGIEPFSVMSCDNISNNGKQLKRLVDNIAAQKKIPGFLNWIDKNVVFHSTMVDRITPMITKENRDNVEELFGIKDHEPIATEVSKELVIGVENGKPKPPFPYESVGALLTEKVHVHEDMKLRMLNGSHMFIGVVGRVGGESFIEEALSKQPYNSLTREFMKQAQGTLEKLPERNYDEYADELMSRFQNPHARDQLIRLARNGSAKAEERFFKPLRIAYEQGLEHRQFVKGIAHWVVYMARANADPSINHDTDEGFFIDDPKAYGPPDNYIAAAKSLNGSVAPMAAVGLFYEMSNSRFGDRFMQELQEEYTAIVHPQTPAAEQDNSATPIAFPRPSTPGLA